jgi:hypothetical protein
MDGIVYIAFGHEYEKLAARTIPYSRRFTKLKMTLFTNLPERRRKGKYPGVNVIFLKMKDNQNREVKTQLYRYTPYDRTLYMDVDAVIQREGIEKIFGFEEDVVLNPYLRWGKGSKILNIYHRAFKMFGVSLPVTIYNGAFILFKRRKTANFFNLWNKYWIKFGKGREMPCLCCAVKNSGVSVGEFKIKINIDSLSSDAMIQHDCIGFIEKFNFPHYKSVTPGDSPSDFRWL